MEVTIFEILISVLAVSFGLWAAVIGWIGKGVFKRLDSIGGDMHSHAEKLNSYIVQTESRLSVVEDRLQIRNGNSKKR